MTRKISNRAGPRLSLAILLCLFLLSALLMPAAYAQFLGFGGRKIVAIPCTANVPPAFLVYEIPGDPLLPFVTMVNVPGTILFSHFAFAVPGAPVMGTYSLPIPCNVYVGVSVVTIGTGVLEFQEGTGL